MPSPDPPQPPSPGDYGLSWGDVALVIKDHPFKHARHELMDRFWLTDYHAEAWVNHCRKLQKEGKLAG